MYQPRLTRGATTIVNKNSPTPERQSGSDKYRSVQHAIRVWFRTKSMKKRESAWQSLRSGKWRGVDPGLYIFTRQLSGFFFVFVYCLFVRFATYKEENKKNKKTKNQGNVFARVVYMPRWSCILSLYDSTVLSVYTIHTRPASSKLERDQTTRQIKCRCTNRFCVYVDEYRSTAVSATHSYIHTTTTTKKKEKENGSSCSGVPELFSSASVAQPQKIYIYYKYSNSTTIVGT